jgi:hypothetical protein
VLCCQVEVSATGWSLVQRSPTECGVSECDREASIMRRRRPPRGCRAIGKKKYFLQICFSNVSFNEDLSITTTFRFQINVISGVPSAYSVTLNKEMLKVMYQNTQCHIAESRFFLLL